MKPRLQQASPIDEQKIRILVVDDDNLPRKLVTEQLARSDLTRLPQPGDAQRLRFFVTRT
jgi:hypothetical protein